MTNKSFFDETIEELAAIFANQIRSGMKANPKDTQIGGDHYKSHAIQPVEFCQLNELNYCESNVIKYVCRHRAKHGKQDLLKAIHYLQLLIEIEYQDE